LRPVIDVCWGRDGESRKETRKGRKAVAEAKESRY
jgi:hypothetical protein